MPWSSGGNGLRRRTDRSFQAVVRLAAEARPSAQATGLPRVGGLHHRCVLREAASRSDPPCAMGPAEMADEQWRQTGDREGAVGAWRAVLALAHPQGSARHVERVERRPRGLGVEPEEGSAPPWRSPSRGMASISSTLRAHSRRGRCDRSKLGADEGEDRHAAYGMPGAFLRAPA